MNATHGERVPMKLTANQFEAAQTKINAIVRSSVRMPWEHAPAERSAIVEDWNYALEMPTRTPQQRAKRIAAIVATTKVLGI